MNYKNKEESPYKPDSEPALLVAR